MSLSLVKYVGGKGWLTAKHGDLLPMPHAGAVVVPFLGGGSVAAHYAARGCRVIASDTNARLVNAHVEIRDAPDLVVGLLGEIVAAWRRTVETAAPADRETAGRLFFEQARERLSEGTCSFRAARLLFVIRAGFNGLYRENAAGECTTAYGKPALTDDLVQADKLRAYAAAVQGVEFLCEDFAVTLARALPGWSAYCDPPYQGTFDGYSAEEWDARQPGLPGMGRVSARERLAAMLRYLTAIGVRWSVSDAPCAVTERLYAPAQMTALSRSGQVNSNVHDRGNVTEGLWRNWT